MIECPMAKQSSLFRKHVPQRSCVICKAKREKRDLTRLVRTDNGIQIDPSGKMNGRGAYVCNSKDCWEKLVRTNTLERALNTVISSEDRMRLQQAIPSS